MLKQNLIVAFAMLLLLISCGEQRGYKDVPLHSKDGHLNAIIEIPAGSTQKVEYEAENQGFKYYKENGVIERIPYLPSPVNYGFVNKQTESSEYTKLILISETHSTGSIVEVSQIGSVEISSADGIENLVVAMPIDKNQRTLKAENIEEIIIEYPEFKFTFQRWYSVMRGSKNLEFTYSNKKIIDLN